MPPTITTALAPPRAPAATTQPPPPQANGRVRPLRPLRKAGRWLALALAGLVLHATEPPSALGAAQCSYSPQLQWVVVTMDADGDWARLWRSPGGASDQIWIQHPGGETYCGATEAQTTAIHAYDTSSGGDTQLQAPARPFGSVEGSFEGEIPIRFSAGSGSSDSFVATGSDGPARVRAGLGTLAAVEVNLNADEPAQDADVEVSLFGIERVKLLGGIASDRLSTAGGTISAEGGPQFNGPVPVESELRGGRGNDELRLGGAGWVWPGTGDDQVHSSAVASPVRVVSYADVPAGVRVDLNAAGPQDTLGAGVDTLHGQFAQLHGSQHADSLIGAPTVQQVQGQGGNDLIVGGGALELRGNEGDDRLVGGADNEKLDGWTGDDLLLPGGGDDLLDGYQGSDIASYADAPDRVTVSLASADPQNTGAAGSDSLKEVENLIGSAFADQLTGNDGPNLLDGLGGDDLLSGLAGADSLMIRHRDRDRAACGADADTVSADPVGYDLIDQDCETIDYAAPLQACQDGLDNDGDGRRDHPDDRGCASPDDTDEADLSAPANTPPVARLTSPGGKRIRQSRFNALTAIVTDASPNGGAVSARFALNRRIREQGRLYCFQLTPTRFKRVKPKHRRCPIRWITARGSKPAVLQLKRRLPRGGGYTAYVRATDSAGATGAVSRQSFRIVR